MDQDRDSWRQERLAALRNTLGLRDTSPDLEDSVVGAMAMDFHASSVCAQMLTAAVFTNADNRQIFQIITTDGWPDAGLNDSTAARLEFYELGGLRPTLAETIAAARGLLEGYLRPKLAALPQQAADRQPPGDMDDGVAPDPRPWEELILSAMIRDRLAAMQLGEIVTMGMFTQTSDYQLSKRLASGEHVNTIHAHNPARFQHLSCVPSISFDGAIELALRWRAQHELTGVTERAGISGEQMAQLLLAPTGAGPAHTTTGH